MSPYFKTHPILRSNQLYAALLAGCLNKAMAVGRLRGLLAVCKVLGWYLTMFYSNPSKVQKPGICATAPKANLNQLYTMPSLGVLCHTLDHVCAQPTSVRLFKGLDHRETC